MAFAAIPDLNNNLMMAIEFIGIPMAIVTMIFAYYVYSQKEMVLKWKKTKGKVESMWQEKERGGVIYKWEVKYEFDGKNFTKTIGVGYPDGQVGDLVILLVDPQKPGNCVDYAPDLLWQAFKKSLI